MGTPRPRRILAVDPGTVHMGVAVLEGRRLLHHDVVTIRDRSSPHEILKEARGSVLRLLAEFRPDVVAIEKAFFAQNRNTALLNVLVDEVRAIARKRGLVLVAVAPSAVKRGLTGSGSTSKREVALAVAARFPELRRYLKQDRRWKEKYESNRFDAVALGIVAPRRSSPTSPMMRDLHLHLAKEE